MNVGIAIAVVIVILILWVIGVYNTIARARVRAQEGWSGIGTYLQERNDLIPNLVETVKGYATHEQDTLTNVIKWRNQSAAARTPQEQSVASAGLMSALGGLYAVSERYPQLQANTNFLELQSTLQGLEGQINYARRYYNGTVTELNTLLSVFPNNMIARQFNIQPEAFFKEDAESHVVPKVSFS
jgi:LemA protein